MLFLDDLNPAQRLGATTINGPLLIVAGPGTGKTKTLTARLAYLLQTGVPPKDIVALTFTKKAAQEMKLRLRQLVEAPCLPQIATFHSLCRTLLDNDTPFIDEPTRLSIITTIRSQQNIKDLSTRELSLAITCLKNGIPTENDTLRHVTEEYNNELRQRGQRDFDDLLEEAVAALQQGRITTTYRYILVDEFQDTNALQYKLLTLLTKEKNICGIGDPLQSIYGFRGANGDIFARFKADFPQCNEVTLTTNYRSAPQIVRLANAIFPKSPQLEPSTKNVGTADSTEVLDEYREADWILSRIEQAVGGTDFLRSHAMKSHMHTATFKDFAVLYRTHHVAKTVIRAFAAHGIPYQVVGEGSMYEKPFFATIINIMRAVITKKPIVPSPGFSAAQWEATVNRIKWHSELLPSELAVIISKDLTRPKSVTDDEIQQFIASLIRFDECGLQAFLQFVEQATTESFYDPGAETVSFLTIHAAKGLEFAQVFLLGTEEDILPHKRGRSSDDALQEERRLFYVAVTRAKKHLHILHARTRNKRPCVLSQFIRLLPNQAIETKADPEIAMQLRQKERRRQKRAQTSLF